MHFIHKAPELNLNHPKYHLDPVVWSAVKALLNRGNFQILLTTLLI
jgi:hypothetical protein